jgi:hypothetical protein
MMSQHDYVIGNDTAANVRADINAALLAIASNNSGASAPATTYANQWWYDSTNGILKIRAEANDAWISVAKLNQTSDQFFPIVGGVEVTATGTEINKLAGLATTAVELGYVTGVTSAIQTQLNAKAALAGPALTGVPTAPTASVGTNTTQLATTAFVLANGGAVNKQTFTSSGTWTKPSGASLVLVRVWGAGGGGAGGTVGAVSTSKSGGSGGGGGAFYEKFFYASELASTVSVTIGAAGTGGASATVGVAGGQTSFGTLVTANGGTGGAFGGSTGGSAQGITSSTSANVGLLAGVGGSSLSYYGGGGSSTLGSTGSQSILGGGGGGGSGWESSGNVLFAGGLGGQSGLATGVGSAGTSSAGAPTAGGAATSAGCGGGGGGSAQTTNGGAGGAGAFPGGGGGAGGTTRTGFSGGAGGAGAAGYCEVYTW